MTDDNRLPWELPTEMVPQDVARFAAAQFEQIQNARNAERDEHWRLADLAKKRRKAARKGWVTRNKRYPWKRSALNFWAVK